MPSIFYLTKAPSLLEMLLVHSRNTQKEELGTLCDLLVTDFYWNWEKQLSFSLSMAVLDRQWNHTWANSYLNGF